MAYEAGDAGMPAFLFIAGIFNILFIIRAIKDVRSQGTPVSGSPAISLLLTAIFELCWVVPCFVQCFVIFVLGDDGAGDFSPNLSFGYCHR